MKNSKMKKSIQFTSNLIKFILLYTVGIINRIVLVPFPFITSVAMQDMKKDQYNVTLRFMLFVIVISFMYFW